MIEHADDATLTESPPWLLARAEALDGGALIMIAGDPDPELFADLDQERVGKTRPVDAMTRQLRAQNERTVNWTIAAYPTEGQATQVFGEPDTERLWEAVAHAVRLDEARPGRSPGTRTSTSCTPAAGSSTRRRSTRSTSSGRAPI